VQDDSELSRHANPGFLEAYGHGQPEAPALRVENDVVLVSSVVAAS